VNQDFTAHMKNVNENKQNFIICVNYNKHIVTVTDDIMRLLYKHFGIYIF